MPVLKNPRHERYVQGRVKGLPTTDAYLAAGYKCSRLNAEKNSARLEHRPDVQARMAELMARAAERAELTAADVIAELWKVATANLVDFIRVQEDGTAVVDLSGMTREQAAAMSEIVTEVYNEGVGEDAREVKKIRFKLHSKLDALGKLMDHFGLKAPTKSLHLHRDATPEDAPDDDVIEELDRLESEIADELGTAPTVH